MNLRFLMLFNDFFNVFLYDGFQKWILCFIDVLKTIYGRKYLQGYSK